MKNLFKIFLIFNFLIKLPNVSNIDFKYIKQHLGTNYTLSIMTPVIIYKESKCELYYSNFAFTFKRLVSTLSTLSIGF